MLAQRQGLELLGSRLVATHYIVIASSILRDDSPKHVFTMLLMDSDGALVEHAVRTSSADSILRKALSILDEWYPIVNDGIAVTIPVYCRWGAVMVDLPPNYVPDGPPGLLHATYLFRRIRNIFSAALLRTTAITAEVLRRECPGCDVGPEWIPHRYHRVIRSGTHNAAARWYAMAYPNGGQPDDNRLYSIVSAGRWADIISDLRSTYLRTYNLDILDYDNALPMVYDTLLRATHKTLASAQSSYLDLLAKYKESGNFLQVVRHPLHEYYKSCILWSCNSLFTMEKCAPGIFHDLLLDSQHMPALLFSGVMGLRRAKRDAHTTICAVSTNWHMGGLTHTMPLHSYYNLPPELYAASDFLDYVRNMKPDSPIGYMLVVSLSLPRESRASAAWCPPFHTTLTTEGDDHTESRVVARVDQVERLPIAGFRLAQLLRLYPNLQVRVHKAIRFNCYPYLASLNEQDGLRDCLARGLIHLRKTVYDSACPVAYKYLAPAILYALEHHRYSMYEFMHTLRGIFGESLTLCHSRRLSTLVFIVRTKEPHNTTSSAGNYVWDQLARTRREDGRSQLETWFNANDMWDDGTEDETCSDELGTSPAPLRAIRVGGVEVINAYVGLPDRCALFGGNSTRRVPPLHGYSLRLRTNVVVPDPAVCVCEDGITCLPLGMPDV